MNELEILVERKGLIVSNNPVLIQLLGLSPVLAVSSTLTYGIGLGGITFLVCVFSCVTASLLRKYIASEWRLVWYMLILASYTSVAEAVSQIYFYPLSLKLGIYLPLICCNVAILVRMETVSFRSAWSATLVDSIKTGLGFLFALTLVSALRELLISGTLLTDWQLLLPAGSEKIVAASVTDDPRFFRFANTQAGAFLLLGMLVAAVNLLAPRSDRFTDGSQEITPVKRARVTGRLSKE